MQKGWFQSRPDVTHNTIHHAENKPLFMWTPPYACMYIDNMDTGHKVLSALIAEQELQHSGHDSTHGWKIEPRDEIWSFVAFCASDVCSRSGKRVKQTHLMQKKTVTHKQAWRIQWVKTFAGERSRGGDRDRNFWKTMICKDVKYAALFGGWGWYLLNQVDRSPWMVSDERSGQRVTQEEDDQSFCQYFLCAAPRSSISRSGGTFVSPEGFELWPAATLHLWGHSQLVTVPPVQQSLETKAFIVQSLRPQSWLLSIQDYFTHIHYCKTHFTVIIWHPGFLLLHLWDYTILQLASASAKQQAPFPKTTPLKSKCLLPIRLWKKLTGEM